MPPRLHPRKDQSRADMSDSAAASDTPSVRSPSSSYRNRDTPSSKQGYKCLNGNDNVSRSDDSKRCPGPRFKQAVLVQPTIGGLRTTHSAQKAISNNATGSNSISSKTTPGAVDPKSVLVSKDITNSMQATGVLDQYAYKPT